MLTSPTLLEKCCSSYLVLKYGLPQSWLVEEKYKKLKVVKEVLPKIHQLVVKKIKANDEKAPLPQYNERKVKDLLRYICRVFHEHELCTLTYKVMQEEVITRDFRNGKGVYAPFFSAVSIS